MGDFVIVINAAKVRVTGKKLDDKIYYRHTGYMGGLKETTLREMLERQAGAGDRDGGAGHAAAQQAGAAPARAPEGVRRAGAPARAPR